MKPSFFSPIRLSRDFTALLMGLSLFGAGSGSQASKPAESILAMYTFQEGGGELVRDHSGVEPGLDLRIQNRPAARWLEGGGLAVESAVSIRSEGAATKIIQACKQSNEITVELWVVPANSKQAGPARMVTLSGGITERNFTLGQHEDRYEARLRTTATSGNGLPRYRTVEPAVQTGLTHLVYSRNRSGQVRFYVNGQETPMGTIPDLDGGSRLVSELPGAFSNWADGFPLVLASEMDRARPWLGQIHGLVIYSRALGLEEAFGDLAEMRANTAPVISQVNPVYAAAFHESEDGLRFTVSTASPNRISKESVRLQLNGEDVSGGLEFHGGETEWEVSWAGLEPDRRYAGTITAADQNGRGTGVAVLFETGRPWTARGFGGAEPLLVPLHHPIDLEIPVEGELPANPFLTELKVIATGPGNRRLAIPGFYKGGNVWCARFSPVLTGDWQLITLSSDPRLSGKAASVIASSNPNPKVRGGVRVDPLNPLHFRYEDGSPKFLFGYEADWLWALDQTAEEPVRLHSFLDQIAGAGFNYFIVNVYAHDTHWRRGRTVPNDFGPPELFAWEGTNENPDHTRLNPAFFDHYDRMMRALHERGLTAHIMIKVYNKLVNWPAPRSPEEDLYFDYVVKRYQAFPNIVWDYSKETYYEPDKKYVYDRLQRIRALDAYRRLTTLHDDNQFTFDPRWNSAIDFITDQNHGNFYDTIIRQRAHGIGPVFNAEYGYEHGPGGPEDRTYGVVQPPIEVLSRTYEVLMAGGYPAYYYTNHAWDIIEWDEMPAGLPGYGFLHAFFTAFPWYALQPQPDLGRKGLRCLTDGSGHLVLFTRTGQGSLSPSAELSGRNWSGYWMNIWTGERAEFELGNLSAGQAANLVAPFDGQPAVAYLRAVD